MENAIAESDSSSIDSSSFKLLVSCPSGLSPSQVSVEFNNAYDRIPHSDVNLENTISEIWEQRSVQNKSLFNGKKFRYGGHVLHAGGGSDHEPHLCIHLGLTDYRTFTGTNLSPLWERFLIPSEGNKWLGDEKFLTLGVAGGHLSAVALLRKSRFSLDNMMVSLPKVKKGSLDLEISRQLQLDIDDSVLCQHTSSPLGNGAVVETIDNKILVLKRSNNVGEFPGYFVFPGGHPEPQEIGIASHQYVTESTESINIKVSCEMFDSIVREVVEEIGVPASSLSIPAFIGISRRVLNVRPAAFFYIKCSLDSKEVQQFYSSAQDGYESTQLYAVPMIELENVTSKMPGCHRGGYALYKLMVDTRKIT